MSGTVTSSRVVVLVKALPQPSKTYGETVCCAGVTLDRQWKRLFPVRFRHLSGEASFKRWDWVKFDHHRPTKDKREESCHVHEESLVVDGQLSKAERTRLLVPMIMPSGKAAEESGKSLALIRPRNPKFYYKRRNAVEVEEAQEAYRHAARQTSMFDKELAELEPSPYEFRFKFEDDAGKHDYECGDWETHTMFWSGCNRHSEAETLKWMSQVYNEEYPTKGMAFAVGNMAKRPQTWQLLGVIRLNDNKQGELLL
ncbi:hypothetical protein [Microvirga sp. 17 mud 1-3]|uniref:hypothetical protein n=1 Tax=Microvirga sp. 17 mud 1-3 TaxID=2082949 RepID=UPI001FE0F998|nr:hypothetical protein [Microvirga sp. 17 mud 1-3]